jgi:hypothetical protein
MFLRQKIQINKVHPHANHSQQLIERQIIEAAKGIIEWYEKIYHYITIVFGYTLEQCTEI